MLLPLITILLTFVSVQGSATALYNRVQEQQFIPPDTVNSLNLTSYYGRWFQMYASKLPNTTIEKNGYCVTADHYPDPTNRKNAAFGLTNSLRSDSPTGDLQQVNGTAFKTSDPGKFTVRVIQSVNQTQSFPYWVVALGAIPPGETLYPWSVVSTPFRTSLFILARDVEQFRTQYQDQVLALVRRKGFTSSSNQPLETYQGTDCLYPPVANGTIFSSVSASRTLRTRF